MTQSKEQLKSVLAASPIFNQSWYLNKYEDIRAAGIDPLQHFIDFGADEGRDPCPLFNTQWYKKQCPDTQSLSPFAHFLSIGARNNLDPHPLFSVAYYKSQLPESYWNETNPLAHYLANAANPHISPHPLFATGWYLHQLYNINLNGMSPLEHFLLYGWKEYYNPHPLFSISYYLQENSYLLQSNMNPLEHYIRSTDFTNLNPHHLFLSDWYMQQYPPVQPPDVNPLIHYIQTGYKQGRNTHPLFNGNWYSKHYMMESERSIPPLIHYVVNNYAIFTGKLAEHQKKSILVQQQTEAMQVNEIHAFVVHNIDCISGGIFSIFSLVEEIRKNAKNAFLYTMPGETDTIKYSQFNNNETLLPFADLCLHIQNGKIFRLYIPEVLVNEFYDAISVRNINMKNVDVTILNQNAELMPTRQTLGSFSKKIRSLSMTTAHLKYSTQQHADKWGLPLKHLSTYMSHDDYQIIPFEKKLPLFFWSPDHRPQDEALFRMLTVSMPGYHFYRIEGVHYEIYKFVIGAAKFTLTLGEGLDNYFIESFFTGGFGFALYNGRFMPQSLRKLDNVFSDITRLKASLSSVIRDIELDPAYRAQLFEANYRILAEIYDKRIYRQKVGEFLANAFDYYPATR